MISQVLLPWIQKSRNIRHDYLYVCKWSFKHVLWKFGLEFQEYIGECPTRERTNEWVTFASRKGVSLWLPNDCVMTKFGPLWVMLKEVHVFRFGVDVQTPWSLHEHQNDMKMTHIWLFQLMLIFPCRTGTQISMH